MNYWRIGCKTYFNYEMLYFFKNRPFVWGSAINGIGRRGRLYLPYLKKVNTGDILVAGGTLNIDFIGEIQEFPKYIPNSINRKSDLSYKADGIE